MKKRFVAMGILKMKLYVKLFGLPLTFFLTIIVKKKNDELNMQKAECSKSKKNATSASDPPSNECKTKKRKLSTLVK